MSVFVGNIPFELTIEEFKDAFKEFGPIEDATIPTFHYKDQIRSQGHGFIDFATPEAKARCLNSGKTIVIKGRTVTYREAKPRPVCDDTCFISELPMDFTKENLDELVSQFNPVEVNLIRENDGERTGFGYAKFANSEVRDIVINALNNKEIGGQRILVRAAKRPFTAEKPARYRRRY